MWCIKRVRYFKITLGIEKKIIDIFKKILSVSIEILLKYICIRNSILISIYVNYIHL